MKTPLLPTNAIIIPLMHLYFSDAKTCYGLQYVVLAESKEKALELFKEYDKDFNENDQHEIEEVEFNTVLTFEIN